MANSSQNVRHFARGQNMQIRTVDVIRCVKQAIIASEGNKRRSGTFFVTGGPVLASCKTPLTRKALSYLYFRKTKSEEHIESNLFGYGTGRTAKDECVRVVPPFRTKFLSTAFKQWRSTEADKEQSQNIYEIQKNVFKIRKNISSHNFFWKSSLKSLSNLKKYYKS